MGNNETPFLIILSEVGKQVLLISAIKVQLQIKAISDFLRRQVKAEFDPDFGDIEKYQKERGRDERKGVHGVKEIRCPIYSGNHRVSQCPTFLDLTVSERIDLIKKHRSCFSCLNRRYVIRDCRLKKACRKNNCGRTHHALIHTEPQKASGASVLDQESIMPVVKVKFWAANGRVREGNVLIDGGAGTTIIRRDFAKLLSLQGKKEGLEISVVGGEKHENRDSHRLEFWISPLQGGEEFLIEAHELDELC